MAVIQIAKRLKFSVYRTSFPQYAKRLLLNSGVASYGTAGHVPLLDFAIHPNVIGQAVFSSFCLGF